MKNVTNEQLDQLEKLIISKAAVFGDEHPLGLLEAITRGMNIPSASRHAIFSVIHRRLWEKRDELPWRIPDPKKYMGVNDGKS